MKSIVIDSPQEFKISPQRCINCQSVFLAGTIDNGKSEDWQLTVINACPEGVTFLNPRRNDWDLSWEQSADNPQFNEQVSWELDNLEFSDIIFMYFAPGSISPISLLEFGLHINGKAHMIVCCPPGYWRKGNIDIVCKRHDVTVHSSLSDAISYLQSITGNL